MTPTTAVKFPDPELAPRDLELAPPTLSSLRVAYGKDIRAAGVYERRLAGFAHPHNAAGAA